jgi:hypothetical protein
MPVASARSPSVVVRVVQVVVPRGPPAEVAVPHALGEPVHLQRRELLLQSGGGGGRGHQDPAGEHDLLAVRVEAAPRPLPQEAAHLHRAAAAPIRARVRVGAHLQRPGLGGRPRAADEHDLLRGAAAQVRGRGDVGRRAEGRGGGHEGQEEGHGSWEQRRGCSEAEERGEDDGPGPRRGRRGRVPSSGTAAAEVAATAVPQLQCAAVESLEGSMTGGGSTTNSRHGCFFCSSLRDVATCNRRIRALASGAN